MKTLKEIRLKNIFSLEQVLEAEKQALKAEAEKLTKKLVLSQVLCFSETPRNHNEILEILKNSLGQTKFRWVNLMFYAQYPADGVSPHSHIKTKIFLFGKRTFIFKNIREISGRIVKGKRWMGKEAGINSRQEFCIKDFI